MHSREISAQMRFSAGLQAYRNEQNKKIKLLNMAFHAVYVLATSSNRFEMESFRANDKTFYSSYTEAFNALINKPAEEKAEETEVTPEIQNLIDLYNYLFK